MTRLFKVERDQLVETRRKPLDFEEKIESWVCQDLSLIGVDGVVIGRQVETDFGGRLDVLAMDQDGNLIIIELKRDKSPRDIVAQILDYASWICNLTDPDIHQLALAKTGRSLADIYREKFGKSLPDKLNVAHQMMIVASEVDEATKRIIEYLSEEHNVGINASFFNVFSEGGKEWLTTDALLEQEEVTDRATRKVRGPWTGFYYVTGGTEEMRPWDDMRKYGFITASGGRWYTDRLSTLSVGDKVFYYQVDNGYLGYGAVTSERQAASDYILPSGQKLVDALPKDYLTGSLDNPDRRAYVVGVERKKTFDRNDSKSFQGIFSNQNTVCKLYSQETVDFLTKAFGADAKGARP